MNPFTALKNLSPLHFTFYYLFIYFYLSYQPFTSLYFAIHIYISLPFTSLSFPFWLSFSFFLFKKSFSLLKWESLSPSLQSVYFPLVSHCDIPVHDFIFQVTSWMFVLFLSPLPQCVCVCVYAAYSTTCNTVKTWQCVPVVNFFYLPLHFPFFACSRVVAFVYLVTSVF
jgi:hypothetical protein